MSQIWNLESVYFEEYDRLLKLAPRPLRCALIGIFGLHTVQGMYSSPFSIVIVFDFQIRKLISVVQCLLEGYSM